MVQISKRYLSEEILSRLFILYFYAVGRKNNQKEFQNIINDLFSPVERIMIAKRVAIIYLLMKNKSHREICNSLKVSIATVVKFKLLTSSSVGIVPHFKRILKQENFTNFIEEYILKTLFPPVRYGSNWSANLKKEFKRKQQKQRGI